jgi:Mor family transcriptional regulator|nr:MAG TPA: Mor transcription activator family [Caudoviricetes sp.]
MEFVDDLTLEMIPDAYRAIAEAIGIENLLKLAQCVGGTTFYMPKAESLVRPVRDERIKAEFNGWNHAALARKYDVTERWVRQICGAGEVENQQSFYN